MDSYEELLEVSGTVESVIYKNEENGYTVLRLRTLSEELITVVGTFPYAAPGESMIVSGEWMTHAVHGKQFKAEFAQRMLPTDANAIYQYLAGGSIKGIGNATASLLVSTFGDRTLDVIETQPKELAKIRGISPAKAESISKAFRQQTGIRRLMEFVCSFGLRPILAMRMFKFYGDEALGILRENPYILAASHIGGSFAEADKLALEMGLDGFSRNRIQAAALFELKHNLNNGHCFIPQAKLCTVTSQLIHVEEEAVNECVEELIAEERIRFEQIAGQAACYLPEIYEAERHTAQRVSEMVKRRFDDRADIAKLIERLEKEKELQYTLLQKKTLELALHHQIVVLTGGPGTGKTTSLCAILALFDALGLKTLLTAPTGRAAQRMTEISGKEAMTVHRLLEAKFADDEETVIFTKNESDRLSCDAVILDESSMVDILLMDALLRAMPPDARLIMVGDADQLPSVGPGNVFSAVIRSQVVPTVALKEIFRQSDGSRIVRNAHMINAGEYPNFSENTGDFFRLRRLQAATSVETITELCAVRLPQRMGIPSDEIQVLTPTRKGELGTASLNRALQNTLNPASEKKHEKPFGEIVFREGDRVMQTKNNYEILWRNETGTKVGTGIYNGDIGRIRCINAESETIEIDFEGRIAEYSFDGLIELEHAWAMTVHKAQGSEYRAVVLALGGNSAALMTRSVLYTAVTRARKLLIMVGDDQIALRMIDNHRQSNRYTALRVRIRTLCGIA